MDINNSGSYEDVLFQNIAMEERTLKEVSFYRCKFQQADFQYAEFRECEFQECVFDDCNLALAVFNSTKVIDSEFNGSKLLGINWGNLGPVIIARFYNCLMDRCSFSGMNLTKVGFEDCSLRDASFADCKLARIKFDNCDFSGCQFHQTDMSRADFSTSRNYFMNAETNKLTKTCFSLPEAVSLLANLDIVLK
ncbi:pentapeptide repeat-containing protein [Maridesulfovibrio sp.]|uniref:pentapeptide repeat-containing protein n=1 Tax=Maridesulfovibrio sp. TaxID=2795000 RepID=UPI002A18BDB0|nr:pentapeptide repeat-containing protein [Maridesulfovibrio sp.]